MHPQEKEYWLLEHNCRSGYIFMKQHRDAPKVNSMHFEIYELVCTCRRAATTAGLRVQLVARKAAFGKRT